MLEFKHIGDKRYVYVMDVNVNLSRAIYHNSEQSKAKMLTGLPFTYIISNNQDNFKDNLIATDKAILTLKDYAKELLKVDHIDALAVYNKYFNEGSDEMKDLLGIIGNMFVHSVNRYLNHVLGIVGSISNYPEDVSCSESDAPTLEKYIRETQEAVYHIYAKYMKEIQVKIANSILAENEYVRMLEGRELPKPMDKSAAEYRLELFLPLFYGPIISLKDDVKSGHTVFYLSSRHTNYPVFKKFLDQAETNHFVVHIDNELATNGCIEVLYNPTVDLFTCYKCRV